MSICNVNIRLNYNKIIKTFFTKEKSRTSKCTVLAYYIYEALCVYIYKTMYLLSKEYDLRGRIVSKIGRL